MLNIEVKTIPHSEQRYPTVGDYWEDPADIGGTIHFRVSQMPSWKYEALVLAHELVEYFLVKAAGISISDIDEFDKKFESDRIQYQWGDEIEPGHDPRAPYRTQHFFAEAIERTLAFALNVDWKHYSDVVEKL